MALRLVTRRCKLRNEPFPVYFVTLPYELYTSLYYKFPLTIVFVKWEFFFGGGGHNVMPDIPPVGYSNAREHASVLTIVLIK